METETKFTNKFSEEIWETTYKYYTDNNIDDTLKRVAKAIASIETTEELQKKWEKKFYDLLTDFKITPGGRILSNAGTEWGISGKTTLINCFVGTKPKNDQDSLEGILEVLTAQAKTLKSEGGYGMNFSFIRPRGSFIYGIGVETPGAVKYMELFDKSSDIITAGSGKKSEQKEAKGKIRKGAQMGCLDCWHPDVEEFIAAKLQENRLSKFNLSVNFSDEFMEKIIYIEELKIQLNNLKDENEINELKNKIEENDKWELIFPDTQYTKYKKEWDGNIKLWKEKEYPIKIYKTIKITELWELVMKSTYERNDPGVLFCDLSNKTHCWNYGKNSFISASNPCVAEGTFVNTPKGYIKVENLSKGDEISTLHPRGYEKIDSIEVTDSVPVFKIKFSDGGEQIVTAAHKYHVQKNGFIKGKFVEKLRLDEIKIGDFIQIEPTHFKENTINTEEYEKGLMFGILLGDGSCGKNFKISTFISDVEYNNNVKKLFEHNGYNFIAEYKNPDGSESLEFSAESSRRLKKDFEIPDIFDSYNKHLLKDNYNYSYTIGIINGILGTNGNINLKSNHPKIRLNTYSKKLSIEIRRLLLSIGIYARITNSFSKGGLIRFTIYNSKLSRNSRSAKVLSIEPFGISKVYDLYCKESDTWITEGYVQQGCGEQMLPFGAVCNLGSLNLTQFIDYENNKFDLEKIKKHIPTLVRFLDNVNEYTSAPLLEYIESIKNRRRIGIGIMGWGSALYILNIRFASDEAEKIKEELMKCIAYNTVEASIDLAIEKGMFKDCEPEKHANAFFWEQIELPKNIVGKIRKYGIRNSALFSIQPTGNTSTFANIVSGGLEPVFLNEYIRTSIVQNVPEHIVSECPKYYEGEFKETNMFKFVKEGTDTILRGIDKNGTVYKIDKNRGLTKETLCEDYGVKTLKQQNKWNPKADWAVTTEQLSVEEHIRDLKGFAKWIDSSCSKTINVPNNYSFENFKNTYLDAYKSKVLKGITTYRAGTMLNVLAAIDSSKNNFSEKIKKTNAPKRPKELPGELHHFSLNKRRYYVAVGLLGDEPYEIFTGINHNDDGDIYIPKTIKDGFLVKHKQGVYSFRATNEEDYFLTNGHADDTADALTRIISCALRHGSPLEFVVDQLMKTKGPMITFSKILSRTVKKYIKDGNVSSEDCPTCSNKLIFSEGCKKCLHCNFSACG